MKKVAVYCGASVGNSTYQRIAIKIGHWLVKNNYDLVFGGGGVGLMGVLAKTVLTDGGKAYGYMPENLYRRGAASQKLTELTIVENMAIRKQKMMAAADVCLALPGGAGTLEEISEAYSWARVGDNPNPCILYNEDGYYDLLQQFFGEMVMKGFLSQVHYQKLCFAKNLQQVDDFIANYTPPRVQEFYK